MKKERLDLLNERTIVEKASNKLNIAVAHDAIALNQIAFESAIARLLNQVTLLREKRQRHSVMLASSLAERTSLNEQLKVARYALKELEKDILWLSTHSEVSIMCPTCGTEHNNSFSSRYGIIDDQESCRDFINSVIDKMQHISTEITKLEILNEEIEADISNIDELLNEQNGDVKLGEMIDSEGRHRAAQIFYDEIASLTAVIGDFDAKISEIDRQNKYYIEPKRRKAIEKYFETKVLQFLHYLNVSNYDAVKSGKIDVNVQNTGSDLPRAILAYDMAILSTIDKYSTFITAPFVVDSPNQQDQDYENAKAMVNLLINNRPVDSQLILGSVSLYGEAFIGRIINLRNENNLLQPRLYKKISHIVDYATDLLS